MIWRPERYQAWLHISNNAESSVNSPPDDLLRELGLIIAARRKESLSGALGLAREVFDHGNEHQRDIILNSILDGLDYLAEELRYDGEHDNSDVPNLRWRCALLASSMSQAGYGDEPAVARWLELMSTEQFPEVRNVLVDDLRESLQGGLPQHRQRDTQEDADF